MLTSEHPEPCTVLQQSSTTPTSIIPVEPSLSPEDKMILYAALQDIANELRRIKRERKNQEHHEEANSQQ